MAGIKKWAVIENNKVINVILAEESFIFEQNIYAIEDEQATVGLDVDENGKIIYPEVVSIPKTEDNISTPEESSI